MYLISCFLSSVLIQLLIEGIIVIVMCLVVTFVRFCVIILICLMLSYLHFVQLSAIVLRSHVTLLDVVCSVALCFAWWILCCPCWTLGFSLRDPPDYYDYESRHHHHHHHQQQQQQQQTFDDDDDESASDPCWPCDNCIKRSRHRRQVQWTENNSIKSCAAVEIVFYPANT